MANHWRGEWSDVYAYFDRMGKADGIAIHHTAGLPTMDHYDPAYLRQIEHGEMARGYNALAYHTMFALDGDSAESRPYGSMGAATGGHNDHTIAFCVPGYFHEPYFSEPTPELLRAMAEEIKVLKYLGFLTEFPAVQPHTWWTAGTQWATACCGSELIPAVAAVEAMSYDNWTPAPEPPPAPTHTGGSPDVIVCWIIWQNATLCYLIGTAGNLIREFPQVDLVPPEYGAFPKEALDVSEKTGRFKLTPDEWKNLVTIGRIRP